MAHVNQTFTMKDETKPSDKEKLTDSNMDDKLLPKIQSPVKQFPLIQFRNEWMDENALKGLMRRNQRASSEKCRKLVTYIVGSLIILCLIVLVLFNMAYTNSEMNKLKLSMEEAERIQAYQGDTKVNYIFQQKKALDEVNLDVEALKTYLEAQQEEVMDLRNMQLIQLSLTNYVLGNQKETDKTLADKLKSTGKKLDDVAMALARKNENFFGNTLVFTENKDDLSMNGTILWKISNFSQKLEYAKKGIKTEFFSDTFYTSEDGYAMYLTVYPNGNREGEGKYLSVYLHLRESENDEFLSWPFQNRFIITLLDQITGEDNVKDSMTPDPTSLAFLRPHRKWTFGSGFTEFIRIDELMTELYLKNDEIQIKAVVDTD